MKQIKCHFLLEDLGNWTKLTGIFPHLVNRFALHWSSVAGFMTVLIGHETAEFQFLKVGGNFDKAVSEFLNPLQFILGTVLGLFGIRGLFLRIHQNP